MPNGKVIVGADEAPEQPGWEPGAQEELGDEGNTQPDQHQASGGDRRLAEQRAACRFAPERPVE